MRLIDADALIKFIDCGHLRNPLEMCFSERDVVDMIESRPTVSQWIPCSERLPEVGQDVIISVANGYLTRGCLYDVGHYWSCLYSLIPRDRVIAWMPLPEPYRE